MEKTISFKIFKQKIIKTDELISVVNQKEESLMKAHKWTQHFKTKLELSRNETNKLKLKYETLSKNLKVTEKNYKCLLQEHDDLQLENNKYERECSNTINDLQIKYQLTSEELTEYKEKVIALEKRLVQLSENESLPLKKKKSDQNMKTSPEKKEITTENKNENNSFSHTLTKLRSENEKLLTEKAELTLETYDLKKELQNLRLLQVDWTRFIEIEDKLKIKEQEVIGLTEKLNNCLEEKNNEIDKLSKIIENMEIENNNLKVENEKLKEENSSYQIEISLLNAANTVQNQSEMSAGNEFPEQLETDGNTSIYQEQVREYPKSPIDEEISTIMQQMFIPTRVTPLPTFSEPDHDDAKLSSPHKTNSDLKKLVIRRRILRKKKRCLARQKSTQVDLFGSLVALKQANINFFISSDSFIPEPRSLLHLPYPKKFSKRSGACAVTKKLSCSLSCCKNSYMVLKDCGEDAPLLGLVGVKDEVTSQRQEFMREENSSPEFLKWAQYQSPAKKRKMMLNYNCEKKGDNKSKNASSQDEFVEAGVKEICGKGKESSERKSQLQKLYKKLDSGQNARLSIENETDEGYSSYRRENTPPPLSSIVINQTPDTSSPVCRSKRRSSPILSVIKKKKVGVNKLQLTKSHDPVVEDEEENSMVLPQTITNNTSDCDNISSRSVVRKAPNKRTSTKTLFKRPVSRKRRTLRLQYASTTDTDTSLAQDEMAVENQIPNESPQSPTPTKNAVENSRPTLIPLDKAPEKTERMPSTKIEVLFNKLILYSAEEEASNEIVREFASQEPQYIAEAILERVAMDYHNAPDTKYNPAPLMTDVQRTMLGFMSKLEKNNVIGVFDNYLALAEHRILCCKELHQFGPITRLYLALCKLQKKLYRMRSLCCDVFYFCGDFAVPFLFMVLTSWIEVLPREADSKDMPIARVLVQIVHMKDCNKPGYNLLPLRDLLTKFYGYPTERWDVNEFFKELFYGYLRNPRRSSDYPLLLYCKNRPEKWVNEQIEEHLKPILLQDIAENFKATLIILIGKLYNRFSSKSEINYLPSIRKWFLSLVTDTTPDVVKRSVYLCLSRLKKK